MDYNEIATVCKKTVAEALGVPEKELSHHPWHSMIHDFAVKHASSRFTRQEIKTMFQAEVDTWVENQQKLIAFYKEAQQRHHDYHVRLYREKHSKLHPDDMANYELAIRREKAGVVKPLLPEK